MTNMDLESYYNKIIERFNFIKYILITDNDGVIVSKKTNTLNTNIENFTKQLKSMSYVINSAYNQLIKVDKKELQSITSLYDEYILFQSKISKNFSLLILSDIKNSSMQTIREISNDIKNNLDFSSINAIYIEEN